MKVSIITITYNRAFLIGKTIQSVIDQIYPDFEHIIIDDGSTDNTEEVIARFNDSRIKYIKVPKKNNINIVRNIGLDNASGEIISILDSDDLWSKDKLQKVCHVFKTKPNVNCVIHNLKHFNKIIDEQGEFYNFKNDFHRNIMKDLLFNKIFSYPILSIKKEYLDFLQLRFDESKKDSQYDFYLKIAANDNVYYINEVLTYMKRHHSNMSKNKDIVDCIEAVDSFEELKKSKKISNYIFNKANNRMLYKVAYFYNKNKQPKQSIKYLKSIRYFFPNRPKLYAKSLYLLIKNLKIS